MKKKLILALYVLLNSSVVWAEKSDTLVTPSIDSLAILPKAQDSNNDKNKEISIDTVDVGADAFYTPFIFANDLDENAEGIKEMVEDRAFAHDEFFMRNIDREEFEMEREFLQFMNKDEKKKKSPFAPTRIYSSSKKEKVETLNPDKPK